MDKRINNNINKQITRKTRFELNLNLTKKKFNNFILFSIENNGKFIRKKKTRRKKEVTIVVYIIIIILQPK